MPAGDHTGPLGAGPRTGRGMGYCSGYARQGAVNPAPGLGLGRGFGGGLGPGRAYGRGMGMGMGRGFRCAGAWGFNPYPSVDEETALAQEAGFLEADLASLRERLDRLKKARKTGSEGVPE